MFWKYNPSSCPHLEVLLNREDVTLLEVMNEEEVVQECKVQNKKLIDYLSRPEVLEHLVSLATEEPSTELEEKQRFRYPNIACELLTCDVPQLNERLAGSETLLAKLYAFLRTPPPLNPLLASFFSKTLAGLVTRRAEQVLEFLKQQEDTVGLLIGHLGTSAIMDLLLRLITGVEGVEMRLNVLTWLESQHVIQRIVELFVPGVEPDRHCNASQLLLDVARMSRDNLRTATADRNEPDPILTRLESQETVSQLLQNMLSGGEQLSESAIVGGVAFLLFLLDCTKPHSDDILGGSLSEGVEDLQRIAHNTAKAILPHLPELHDVLLNPPRKPVIRTTAGVLDPPLGNTRLQVARLISALIGTQDPETLSRLAELGTFNILLDLFFQYRWNNFLHSQVEQCIAQALRGLGNTNEAPEHHQEGANVEEEARSPGSSPGSPPANPVPEQPDKASSTLPTQDAAAAASSGNGDDVGSSSAGNSDGAVQPQGEAMEQASGTAQGAPVATIETKEPSPLVFNLFGDCRLLDRILEAWKSGDSEEGSRLQQRCGYYGHLVLIANSVVERVPEAVMERVVPDEQIRVAWQEFVAGPLADINKVQSEFLGGQHPARMVAPESDDGEYQNIPFQQEDSMLQTFNELQTRYTTAPFVESFGYDDNQFFDGEDPMQLGNSDEMERRAEMFSQVCRQKMMMAADEDDLEDQELTFQTAASSHSRPAQRTRMGSADSDEAEEERAGPEGREASAVTMEVDSTDPWQGLDTALDSVAPLVDSDPWAEEAAAASTEGGTTTPQQEGWADFCSFAPEPSAEGQSNQQSSPTDLFGEQQASEAAGANPSEDSNANPSRGSEDSSQLVDNFRYLSQGLMSASEVIPSSEEGSSSTVGAASPADSVETSQSGSAGQSEVEVSGAPKPSGDGEASPPAPH